MLRPRHSFVTVVTELYEGLSDGTLTLGEVPGQDETLTWALVEHLGHFGMKPGLALETARTLEADLDLEGVQGLERAMAYMRTPDPQWEVSWAVMVALAQLTEVPPNERESLESAAQRIEVARELEPELVPELMLELELALAKLSSARLSAALERWNREMLQDEQLLDLVPETHLNRFNIANTLGLLVRRAEARNNVLERALTRLQQAPARSSEPRSFSSRQRGKTTKTEP